MTILRVILTVLRLLDRFLAQFNQWKWVEQGRRKAFKQMSKRHRQNVEKAKAARNSISHNDIDSLREDPYLRD